MRLTHVTAARIAIDKNTDKTKFKISNECDMSTLIVLAESAAFIGALYIINHFFGGKHNYSRYWTAFLLMCAILFLFKSEAHANATWDRYVYDYYNLDFNALSDNERKLCVQQMDKCERMGKYHYNLAKDRSWWLPNISDRDKARHCFTGAVANLATFTPQSKIIAAIAWFMTSYGLACLDEWNYINDNLMQSQAWWESYEFYKSALDRG